MYISLFSVLHTKTEPALAKICIREISNKITYMMSRKGEISFSFQQDAN